MRTCVSRLRTAMLPSSWTLFIFVCSLLKKLEGHGWHSGGRSELEVPAASTGGCRTCRHPAWRRTAGAAAPWTSREPPMLHRCTGAWGWEARIGRTSELSWCACNFLQHRASQLDTCIWTPEGTRSLGLTVFGSYALVAEQCNLGHVRWLVKAQTARVDHCSHKPCGGWM